MIEKWEKHPGRVGLLIGFVAIPLLWWLQSRLIYLAFGYGSPSSFEFIAFYWIWGAIPGAICGRGISQSLFAWRQQDGRKTKSNLLWHGGVAFAVLLLMYVHLIWQLSQNPSTEVVLFGFSLSPWLGVLLGSTLSNLPFQCTLLMLFIGLLMRSRR